MSLSASLAVIVPIAVVFSATASVPTAANDGALFAGGVGGVYPSSPPPPPPPPHEAMKTVVNRIENNLLCIMKPVELIK